MKHLLAAGLAILVFILVTLIPTARTPAPHKINQLYVFGDSLSDMGTVFRATGGRYPSPPYFQGRYSNGQVWVENLAEKLALTPQQIVNFACGGATTGDDRGNGIPDLLSQVDRVVQTHPQINSDALFVLWAGANDYLTGLTNPTQSVAHVVQAIRSLATIGGRRFLVANLPNLGNLPATHSVNSERTADLTQLTIAHNRELTTAIAALRLQLGRTTQLVQLDVYALYQAAIAAPAQFGFTNVTSACVENAIACSHPDQFLFWDSLHPTASAHRLLAKRAFSALAANSTLVEEISERDRLPLSNS